MGTLDDFKEAYNDFDIKLYNSFTKHTNWQTANPLNNNLDWDY